MGCGGSKSAAVSPDYPKKKDSIPKRTAPTSMSLEEKTALMEKFNAKLFDGTIADGTVTTADCTFNPPGAPAMIQRAEALLPRQPARAVWIDVPDDALPFHGHCFTAPVGLAPRRPVSWIG